ncbi:MAG: amino acid ABC transporter substrate-binding protein [Alphaproteobacteria bacterium]|nr:amino acid ABC transporter substrate-binding protein [Alphaproteobacteria bacterium]
MKTGISLIAVSMLSFAALFSSDMAMANHRGDNTVLIGGAISMTGRYSEPAGRNLNSIKLWVEDVNKRGGLLGHTVEIKYLDDKSDKQTSIKLYEKLISDDKVDLVSSPYSSGITDAVANVTERFKMPMITFAAASSVIWEKGRRYIFNTIDYAENYQKGALFLAKEIGVKRIAIIGEDSLFPRMTRKGVEKWAEQLGLEIVLAENYGSRKQGDYTALLQKIKSKRAQAIFSNSYFADAASQIRTLREMDYNLMIFASTVGPGLPRFANDLGPTAEYVLGFTQWEPIPEKLGYPGMKEYIAGYTEKYGTPPNYHAGAAYGAMQVLEAAVIHAGSFDSEKIRDAYASIDVMTMFGRYKVDEKGLSSHKGMTFQIQNGKRMIVWPKEQAQVEAILPMPKWSER